MNRTWRKVSDSGFTLIELIIAAALTIIVLVTVGSFLVSAGKAATSTRTATAAATLGQLVARSVTQGVANATAVGVTTDSTSGAQMLQARVFSLSSTNDPTQGNASGVGCEAWFYLPTNGGAVYVKQVFPASAIAMPTGTPDSTWQLVGNGLGATVSEAESSTVFAAPSGTRVDLKFDVVNGSQKPVHIETTIHIPNTTTVSSPCF
ncbi:PulJ/GspJ family protein [Leifsonia sp. AG29]|uniref:PulJ/GspJ family protein n=1 Tax=Leifsonia sp. AG29 TaxID=2598860 RepID=UPI00131AFD02|nr:prepilin-type N-terminal cleavage/methylation domain-containing protein [Leifsonia sp. AG29]